MRFGEFKPEKKPIGTGTEKETFVNPHDPKKVISVFKGEEDSGEETTQRMLKGSFYVTKIAHLLLPKHIPDVYQTGETHSGQQTIDRQRVPHTPGHRAFQKALQAGTDGEEVGKRIIQEMGPGIDQLDIELERMGFTVDSYRGNYTKNKQGDVQYFDTFPAWQPNFFEPEKSRLMIDVSKLRKAIEELSHRDPDTAKQCETYLERVLALFEEEKAELQEDIL
jgi:hypothetical protein